MERFVKIYLRTYDMKEAKGTKEMKYQHILGRILLKQGLIDVWNTEFTEDILITETYGKPGLNQEGMYFNISHCKGVAVCALSDVPIGVDVERPRPVNEGILKKACSEAEREYILNHDVTDSFLRLWTLKESYIKMTGEGLRCPLRQVDFAPVSWKDQRAITDFIGTEEIQCSLGGYFYQMRLEEGGLLAVCTKEQTGKPVVIRGKGMVPGF